MREQRDSLDRLSRLAFFSPLPEVCGSVAAGVSFEAGLSASANQETWQILGLWHLLP